MPGPPRDDQCTFALQYTDHGAGRRLSPGVLVRLDGEGRVLWRRSIEPSDHERIATAGGFAYLLSTQRRAVLARRIDLATGALSPLLQLDHFHQSPSGGFRGVAVDDDGLTVFGALGGPLRFQGALVAVPITALRSNSPMPTAFAVSGRGSSVLSFPAVDGDFLSTGTVGGRACGLFVAPGWSAPGTTPAGAYVACRRADAIELSPLFQVVDDRWTLETWPEGEGGAVGRPFLPLVAALTSSRAMLAGSCRIAMLNQTCVVTYELAAPR